MMDGMKNAKKIFQGKIQHKDHMMKQYVWEMGS